MDKPRFTWSHSALADFKNCPLAYAHKRYYKDVTEEAQEHLTEGTRVHKALERVLRGEPTLDEHADVVEKYKRFTDVLLLSAEGGELLTEFEMAINEQMEPTAWFGADTWGRGVIDVAVIKGDTAYIYDWKTGKVKDDDTQLKLFCAFLSIFRPEVTRFVAKFIWLKFGKITGFSEAIGRERIPRIWSDVLTQIHRVKQAWDSEVWQAKPSGLCPWCAYNERCEYRR